MKKILAITFVAIAAMMVVTARGNRDAEVDTNTFRIGSREIATSLDTTDSVSGDYLVNVGAGELLFKIDESGKAQPSLAEKIEQVSDSEWKITLRKEAAFWSGKSVDANAVIASLEDSRKKDLKALPFISMLSFEKSGDYMIKVTSTQKNIDVAINLAYFQLVIHNTDFDYTDVSSSDYTGMYKITEFVPNEKMVLVRNEDYWGKKPSIKNVINERIADEQVRVLAALSGEYNVVMNIPSSSFAQFTKNTPMILSPSEATNSETIYLNLSKDKFKDKNVRQALSYALDREELIIMGKEGMGSPVTTWIGSNPAYSDIKTAIYGKKADREKASALLDKAGWQLASDGLRYKNGELLTVNLMTWGVDQALGEAIQSQWATLGIDAHVNYGDYSLIVTARESGEWDCFIEAWTTFGNVPALLKGQYSPAGGGNYGKYNNADVNKLFEKLDVAQTNTEREKLIRDIATYVAEDAPVICICPRPDITAVNKNVKGFTPHFRQFENVINANLVIK
ncbi:MAG: hypothetical protein K6E51_12370 [Treponema sp.]|nr:hypothetical protein [Treponema sp.]